MTWASHVVELLETVTENISSQFITHLAAFNGTARGNVSMIANIYMPASGALGISVMNLGASSKIGLERNATLAYLNSGAALDADAVYGFDVYVNQSDKINVQTNVSTDLTLDLYFRRS